MNNHKSFFETDKRLLLIINDIPSNLSVVNFCQIARTQSQIKFSAEENEIKNIVFFTGCSKITLKSLMDAISSSLELQWAYSEKNGYKLIDRNDAGESVFGLKNDPFRKERSDLGMQFIDESKNLSENVLLRLQSPQGITAKELPSNVFKPILKSIQMRQDQVRKTLNPGESVTPIENIPLDKIKISVQKQTTSGDFDAYKINTQHPAGGGSFLATNYGKKLDQKRLEREKMPSSWIDPIYTPIKFSVKRKDYEKIPLLQKNVSFEIKKSKITDIMQYIYKNYNVNFLCDDRRLWKQVADVRIAPMPLYKALDKIASVYQETEWEWRESGMLIFRGPTNPSRDRSKGRASLKESH